MDDFQGLARQAAAGADSYGSPHFQGYHDATLGMGRRLAATGAKFSRRMQMKPQPPQPEREEEDDAGD